MRKILAKQSGWVGDSDTDSSQFARAVPPSILIFQYFRGKILKDYSKIGSKMGIIEHNRHLSVYNTENAVKMVN